MTLARLRAEDREEGIAIGKEQGIIIGKEQGERNAKQEAARNLLAMHILSDEQIAQAQGLELSEVQRLASELAV